MLDLRAKKRLTDVWLVFYLLLLSEFVHVVVVLLIDLLRRQLEVLIRS